jgi:hypothetical protein
MSSATMTTTINTTTDERLLASARSTLSDITQQVQALPDEGDIATANEQTRVWQRRQTLSKHSLNLTVRLNHFADLSPMFEPLRLRRDKYLATKIELEKALGEMEALQNPDSRQERIIGHPFAVHPARRAGARRVHAGVARSHVAEARREAGAWAPVQRARWARLRRDAACVVEEGLHDARKQLVSALESAAAFVAATVAPTTVSKG